MKLLAAMCAAALIFIGCLQVPENTHLFVSEGDRLCTSTNFCPSNMPPTTVGFYYAPIDEIVMDTSFVDDDGTPNRPYFMHELCHAHQDWSIEEAGLDASLDLREWFDTEEGQSYQRVIDSEVDDRGRPPNNAPPLEDFAWACSWFYTDNELALEDFPKRRDWMEENLPAFGPKLFYESTLLDTAPARLP